MMHFRIVVLLAFTAASEAVRCKNCVSFNNQACVLVPDCEGDYCLYQDVKYATGAGYVLKTCAKADTFTFDDGMTISNKNQCVTRTTQLGKYYVSMCNTGDHCNEVCTTNSLLPSTLPPIGPVPSSGPVTCYDCETSDGSDCQSGTCQGAFCLYERRLEGQQTFLRKSCLVEPVLLLDDQTTVEGVDICEVRNTATSRYYVKICNDFNLCNNYCDPGQYPTLPPQRQPLVTCYDCSAYDHECFTGNCQSYYCLYERQRRVSTNRTYYKKSCSALSYVEYPDNTPTKSINTCEYRLINDVEYNVKLCNNGNNCNGQCNTNNVPASTVTCASCEATNQDDCTGTTCTGYYCIFERQKSSLTGQSYVKKSCSNVAVLSFPDNTAYYDFNHCQYKSIGSTSYALKACNSTAFCNTACSDQVLPTPSPSKSAHGARISIISQLFVFIVVFVLVK